MKDKIILINLILKLNRKKIRLILFCGHSFFLLNYFFKLNSLFFKLGTFYCPYRYRTLNSLSNHGLDLNKNTSILLISNPVIAQLDTYHFLTIHIIQLVTKHKCPLSLLIAVPIKIQIYVVWYATDQTLDRRIPCVVASQCIQVA